MSLLHSIHQGATGSDYFVPAAANSTPALPVIGGTVVQLCQGGPFADGTVAGQDLIYSGVGQGLRLGVAGVNTNCLQIGPTANIFTNVPVIASATVQMGPGTRIEMLPPGGAPPAPGAALDFNNLSAQGNVLSSFTTLPTPIADGATVAIANPVALTGVDGVFAVMLRGAPGDGQEARMAATIAAWVGGLWVSGGATTTNSGGFFTEITPNGARTSLQVVNNSGANLTGLTADFYLLARINA